MLITGITGQEGRGSLTQLGLKIIVNLDSISHPLTGIGHFSLNLIEALRNHPEVESLFCNINSKLKPCPEKSELLNLIPNSSEKDKNFLSILKRRFRRFSLPRRIYKNFKNYHFLKQTRERKGYIYLETAFLLKSFPGPGVPIIYDLTFLRYPEFHIPSINQKLTSELPDTLARASKIITLSNCIKNEIISYFNVPERMIEVLPPGINPEFKPRNRLEILPILRNYKLPEKYLLCVGTLEPRKNTQRLIKGYSQLPDDIRLSCPLILAGSKGWLNESLERDLMPLEKRGEMIRLGYVVQEDLPFIYSGAHAFIYPSIYEGFGLPVLEAMASGIPILCSQKTAMAEFAEGAAILVDPLSLSEITQGLKRLLLDKENNASLTRVGLETAKNYTWKIAIERWVSVLKRSKIHEFDPLTPYNPTLTYQPLSWFKQPSLGAKIKE